MDLPISDIDIADTFIVSDMDQFKAELLYESYFVWISSSNLLHARRDYYANEKRNRSERELSYTNIGIWEKLWKRLIETQLEK